MLRIDDVDGLPGIVAPKHQDRVIDACLYLLRMDVTPHHGWGTSSTTLRDLLVYSGISVNVSDLNR